MTALYKKFEVVGTSTVSFSDAIKNAVAEAARTVRHMDWFEVAEQRGRIKDGNVELFQATIKIGFRVERE